MPDGCFHLTPLVRGEVKLLERCLRRGHDVPKAHPLVPKTAREPNHFDV